MEYKYEAYDVAVIGAGHAGCESGPSPVRVSDLRRLFLQLVLKALQ